MFSHAAATTARARGALAASVCPPAPQPQPQQQQPQAHSPLHPPRAAPALARCLFFLRRGLQRAPLALPLLALAVLAAAALVWAHAQSCGRAPAAAASLGAFPAHQRRDAPPPPPPAPQLDIVYVSAFPQHLRSSLRSLCHFLRPAGVGAVHLVVPDRMVAFFEASLPSLQCPAGGSSPGLAFRVWGESRLVPAFTQAARHSGTVRQMALKLAAAAIVGAPFYLVMDSDVYARRPFGVEDLLLPSGSGGPLRARTGLDQLDFSQPAAWFRDAARLLQSAVVEDTDAYCSAVAGGAGAAAPAWFAATGNATPPAQGAFALRPPLLPPGASSSSSSSSSSSGPVYGACRSGRGHATHVTPMLLARAVVAEVLQPRLAAAAGPRGTWVSALLDFQAAREAQCWVGLAQALAHAARFYTWTEYSLYFVAGVASGALDQYHAFPPDGGITSYAHSIMLPSAYDAADWDAIFLDAQDSAPFFIVHSWFNKPLALTNARLARHIPGLGEEGGGGVVPQPSPLPLYA
jgi:hypothetical protein